jgi:hypothetical protein
MQRRARQILDEVADRIGRARRGRWSKEPGGSNGALESRLSGLGLDRTQLREPRRSIVDDYDLAAVRCAGKPAEATELAKSQ